MEQTPHLAGQKIRAWREAHGLSAEELGERLNPDGKLPTPRSTVCNWEVRGKIARPNHQRRLMELGVCRPEDWLSPAVATEREPLAASG